MSWTEKCLFIQQPTPLMFHAKKKNSSPLCIILQALSWRQWSGDSRCRNLINAFVHFCHVLYCCCDCCATPWRRLRVPFVSWIFRFYSNFFFPFSIVKQCWNDDVMMMIRLWQWFISREGRGAMMMMMMIMRLKQSRFVFLIFAFWLFIKWWHCRYRRETRSKIHTF